MANAHNQTVGRMSPRQKMINLMYIVLTAMLALNVSSDVLNGFTQVPSTTNLRLLMPRIPRRAACGMLALRR